MIAIFLVAFGLRLILSFLPGISFDMGTWFGWANRLVSLPWENFYSQEIWTHYTPGYFYVLFLLKKIELLLSNLFSVNLFGVWQEVFFKLPANLADIATSFLIYKILEKKSKKLAFLGAAFYLFNLAVIFNSSIWGQIDSVVTFLMLLSVYLSLNKRIFFSSFIYALSFLVKPQALFLAPVFFFLLINKEIKKTFLKFGLIFLLTVLLLSLPFFKNNPLLGLWKMIFQMGADYPGTTLNAFNFWHLFGNWQSDQRMFLGLTKYYWGLGLFLFFEILILLKAFWQRKFLRQKSYLFLLASLLLLNFFLFPTRIHERYFFPFFAFFVIFVFGHHSLKLVSIYLGLSLIHFFNLYHVYTSYQPNFLKVSFFYNLISNLSLFFSLTTIIVFLYLLYLFWKRKNLKSKYFNLLAQTFFKKPLKISRKKIKKVFFKDKLLIFLLLFSFLVRFWGLNYPTRFHFDEVYHAFTAIEMAKGNVKAWEWWNVPPEGVAYEWTHPPLAKLFMTGGILIFGETAFGWRFFGALLGVGCVLLVYLLGRKLFDEKIAFLAAFLFAFDGLPLVMSRIGMNDIYFLFFALLTLWLFLGEEYLFAGLTFGLSVSSKWTAIYLLPILLFWRFLKFWQQKKDKRLNYLRDSFFLFFFCFLVIPVVIYLLVYLPFFLSGHSGEQWWELQHQMWWYHTRLSASHGYQSQALSWPLLVRPVWFFVDYQGKLIANIYAMGNPLIWWGGLISLPFVIWQAIKKRKIQLGLVIFAYFAFFLPWVFSPRIMFIHHYLPAVPFLCLFLGWVLNWQLRKRNLVIVYLLLIGVSFVFFYPHWIGIHVPKWLDNLYYWFPSWK